MLRLVLIGKTGTGKSKTGNTILNRNTAKPSVFTSSSKGTSETEICQMRSDTVLEKTVQVVDTPGLLDNRIECQKEVLTEITRSIYLSTPGPHAILLVCPMGRFLKEDVQIITDFVKHFGEALYGYLVIVFTRYDDMKRDSGEDMPNIKSHVDSIPSDEVKNFIMNKCKGRVVAFDNTLQGLDAEAQVIELFTIIDTILRENNGSCYTNEDYKKADEIQKAEMEKERKRLEKEHAEELKKKQEEIDRAANEIAREKIKAEEQRLKDMFELMLRQQAQNGNEGLELFNAVASFAMPGLNLAKLF